MIAWDKIKKEYENTEITLSALANKHDIKLGTLKSRKSREKWQRATKKDATTPKKVASKKKKDATTNLIRDDAIEVFVESDELTEKQRLFCVYYVKSFNATQSAIKAGYAPESAHVEGSRLLRHAKVSNEIKRIKQDMTQGIFIDAMDVLQKWVKIAFADVTDYLTFGQKEVEVMGAFGPIKDEDGNVITRMVNYVEFNASNTVDGTLISEVKQGRDGISVKLADKMKALEKLSLYFDLFPDKFKREIEEEKLKLAQIKAAKDGGDNEEFENDGFIEALDGKTAEVWGDD
ncbi:terminase small subunit [Priestia megaterium]|uniref:terminase small subunit n=1 Tax=Priestia megaterium TaxID=1404 RepID=UPI0011A92038|nr:terminase small subunit [Priestia megaterium]